MRHRPSFNLHPSSLLLPLPWGYSRRVISLVYLRVTAEGCGDNGHTLNDAFEAPQVDPLHPGAWDYAVAQRRQHYLEHRQQKQQWDRGEPTAGARGKWSDREKKRRKTWEKRGGILSRKEYKEWKEGKKEGRYIIVRGCRGSDLGWAWIWSQTHTTQILQVYSTLGTYEWRHTDQL